MNPREDIAGITRELWCVVEAETRAEAAGEAVSMLARYTNESPRYRQDRRCRCAVEVAHIALKGGGAKRRESMTEPNENCPRCKGTGWVAEWVRPCAIGAFGVLHGEIMQLKELAGPAPDFWLTEFGLQDKRRVKEDWIEVWRKIALNRGDEWVVRFRIGGEHGEG